MKGFPTAVAIGSLDVEFFSKTSGWVFSEKTELIGPYPSGPCGIFSVAFAKLGGKSGAIAAVGDDGFGECILNQLKKYTVDTREIAVLPAETTGTAFTSYFLDGSRRFLYHLSDAAPGKLRPRHVNERYIAGAKWLHISGNALGLGQSSRDALYKAAQIAHENGVPISFDPNLRFEMMQRDVVKDWMEPILSKAKILFPSVGELPYMAGCSDEDEAIRLLLARGSTAIVRKEGAGGSTVFTAQNTHHVDSYSVNEVDPTGCGDAFCAGFAYGVLQGWDYVRAAAFANAVGALTATKKGAMEGFESIKDVYRLQGDLTLDKGVNIANGNTD